MNKKLVPELVKFLVEKDIAIMNVKTNHSLENYFLQLTNSTI